MPNPTAALSFRSVKLTEERLLGRPDDHALSTVRFDATYPDGRVERNVVVQVWHALGPVSEGVVRIIMPAALPDALRDRSVAQRIEDYYRSQAGALRDRARFS